MSGRILCWFSCGAASAVATRIAISENNKKEIPDELIVVRCYVAEEHSDNQRFADDCEKWFDQKIVVLQNDTYKGSIYETFRQRKYIAGIQGASCTKFLKKEVRKAFQQHGDRQVFGYTLEEQHRVDDFIDANNDVDVWPVLVEKKLSHANCLAIVKKAGIELPAMYKLGYKNNNCIGCVKGGAGYWNKIRVDFPIQFQQMSEITRQFGVRLIKLSSGRIFLDELQPGVGHYPTEPEVQCGIACELVASDLSKDPSS